MIYIIPGLISFTLGLLTLKAVLKDKVPGPLLVFFLSATLGLGLSGFFTLTSFFLLNRLNPAFVILLHLAVLTGLGVVLGKSGLQDILSLVRAIRLKDILALGAITALIIPMLIFSRLYPNGGWDAWGFWNTKARFLFLGGSAWSHMFDPALWRVQTSYPFLLPLINVWFWCFSSTATYAVPAAMTCIIPWLTAGLLYSGLRELTQNPWMILAPLWIFTNMFIVQLSASQYSDLLVGLFLLAAMIMFILFQTRKASRFLLPMGFFLGLMAFTKVDGTALGGLTLACACGLIISPKDTHVSRRRAIAVLTASTALGALPLVIFITRYAPANNHIFINGLTSQEHPATCARLATVLVMLLREIVSFKWNGLWIGIGAILACAGIRPCLRPGLRLIPAVLSLYLILCTATYAINTAYDITWWLDSSLNRIVFALIPAAMLWAFLAHEK